MSHPGRRSPIAKRRSVARFGPDDGTRVVIDDPATLKALYDPLRFEIVGLLSEPRTVKELAEALDRKPSGLYHHVNLLEEKGLVKVVEERVVGRRLERLYQRAASAFESTEELSDAVGGLMADRAVAKAVRHVRRAMRPEGEGPERRVRLVADIGTELTPDQAAAVEQAIHDFVEQQIGALSEASPQGAGRVPYRLLIAMAPDDEDEPPDGERRDDHDDPTAEAGAGRRGGRGR